MADAPLEQEELDRLLSDWEIALPHREADALTLTGEVHESGVLIIHVHGRTLGTAVSQVVDQLCRFMEEQPGHVVLDMGECQYLSSFAFGALARLAVTHRAAGWTVVVAAASERVTKVAEIMGFQEVLSFYTSIDEAVAALLST